MQLVETMDEIGDDVAVGRRVWRGVEDEDVLGGPARQRVVAEAAASVSLRPRRNEPVVAGEAIEDVVAALLPMISLASVLPVPLMLALPVSVRFSIAPMAWRHSTG